MNFVNVQVSQDENHITDDEIPLSSETLKITKELCLSSAYFALDSQNIDDTEVHIHLSSQKEIQKINSKFRNNPSPTDVISFSYTNDNKTEKCDVFDTFAEATPLGDLSICPQYILMQAKEHKQEYHVELTRIIIHGILHLCGYEHKSYENTEPMLVKQEQLLDEFLKKNKQSQKKRSKTY